MRISEGGVSRQRARHVQMPWGKIVPAVVQGAVNNLGGGLEGGSQMAQGLMATGKPK